MDEIKKEPQENEPQKPEQKQEVFVSIPLLAWLQNRRNAPAEQKDTPVVGQPDGESLDAVMDFYITSLRNYNDRSRESEEENWDFLNRHKYENAKIYYSKATRTLESFACLPRSEEITRKCEQWQKELANIQIYLQERREQLQKRVHAYQLELDAYLGETYLEETWQDIAYLCMKLGNLLISLEWYDLAKEYFTKAIQALAKVPRDYWDAEQELREGIVELGVELAEYFLREEEREKAKTCYDMSAHAMLEAKDENGEYDVSFNFEMLASIGFKLLYNAPAKELSAAKQGEERLKALVGMNAPDIILKNEYSRLGMRLTDLFRIQSLCGHAEKAAQTIARAAEIHRKAAEIQIPDEI